MLISDFCRAGKVDVVIGGQYGSEGKGAASAFLYKSLYESGRQYDMVSTNAGAQSGHTSVHQGRKRVLFHLPTYGVLQRCPMYLNAGAVIDPEILFREMEENNIPGGMVEINPNAAVITQDCKDAEMRTDSPQTKIASTRKGVGEAIARKVLRSGMTAKDHPGLGDLLLRRDLNGWLINARRLLLEVPQGISLSLNSRFYPHCTSRDCTVAQAMSDAGVHPLFIGRSILVMRTFPIRVGNIPSGGNLEEPLGHSGDCYPDQREIGWEELGQPPEITTVTKRVRRVFSWSFSQLVHAMSLTRPHTVYLTFCDYLKDGSLPKLQVDIRRASAQLHLEPPQVVCQFGPSTDDVGERRTPNDDGESAR